MLGARAFSHLPCFQSLPVILNAPGLGPFKVSLCHGKGIANTSYFKARFAFAYDCEVSNEDDLALGFSLLVMVTFMVETVSE